MEGENGNIKTFSGFNNISIENFVNSSIPNSVIKSCTNLCSLTLTKGKINR